ncbi:CUB and sushi domain-containing protein 3-like [Dendronephthya gigantea]|uniref:CUB and sushi domain-containing protein 3-like n=1 Tax=Dendronephthya gigantea TaxID=151771 RepID=UPI00106A791C|nr:CUB and sushi domain-containing protein 3-like [Dendronephthya gigantea]
MSASIAFVLIGVVLPTLVQGQYCPRTIKEDNNYCARGCTPFRGCSSGRRECICDGDCGYSCIKRGLTCKHLEPRTLANGKIVVKSQKFNDTAVFTCNPGFLLSGSSVRRCRGMGTWDGEEAKCGKNCVDPGVSNNTLRREPIRNTSETFRLSEVLHYYCNAGYLIEGKDSITCQADGTWDGKTPQCYRVSCPPPKLPANSEVYYPTWFTPSQGAKHNSRIFLKCNPGYMKLGSSQVMTCLNQTWKLPASFECLPKNCGDPGVPANGGKNGLIYNFKSKVTFYCDECYKLIGVTYRVCNADQNWSDEQPSCKKVQTNCKSISNIPNGKTSLTGSTNVVRSPIFHATKVII